MQKTALLYRAASLLKLMGRAGYAQCDAANATVSIASGKIHAVVAVACGRSTGSRGWRREVGNFLGNWMLRANSASVDAVALAGLGHGVVATVKIFALFQMLCKMVGAAGQLAVEAEEALLIGRE